jgi:hypothetical protein
MLTVDPGQNFRFEGQDHRASQSPQEPPMTIQPPRPARPPVWLGAGCSDFDAFRQIVSQASDPADTPLAADIIANIPVYAGADVDAAAAHPASRQALMEEWATVLAHGAGILVIRQGMHSAGVVDRATVIFERIIAD